MTIEDFAGYAFMKSIRPVPVPPASRTLSSHQYPRAVRSKGAVPSRFREWVDAYSGYRLSHVHPQTAREQGLNPNRLDNRREARLPGSSGTCAEDGPVASGRRNVVSVAQGVRQAGDKGMRQKAVRANQENVP